MKLTRSIATCSLLALAACSSGLGTGGPGTDASGGAAARSTGLGLDLGVDLTSGLQTVSVAGAVIPGVTPAEDRRIVFLAVTTDARADNADGVGTPLVRDNSPPDDNNGANDVFLVAIEDDLVDRGSLGFIPTAFSRALVNTFRHDRCVHCHAMGTVPGPGEELAFPGPPHPGGAEPITSDLGCSDCHNAAAVPELAGFEWRAPLEANGDFDFRGRTVQELAMKAMSEPLVEHLLNDGRVTWAIESGNVPFVAPRPGGNAGASSLWNGLERDIGAVPVSMAVFSAQLEVWRDAGFPVTAANTVRDVVLVSESSATGDAANGASNSPSLTWIPNPAYDPSDPTAQPAGEVVIVYASVASNLVAGGDAQSDIYLTRVSLSIDRDPATGAVAAGALDLETDAAGTELVSVSSTGGSTNGDSTEPVLDANADLVVYTSTATNIVAGFVAGDPGGRDVFCRNREIGANYLVSATTPGGNVSGDDNSFSPTISATGRAIAFVSAAQNLAPDDTNGLDDIYFAAAAGEPLQRASVTSGGAEGTGGACRGPSVAVRTNGSVAVVFTSTKTNLGSPNAMDDIFLRENGTTSLISQVRAGGSSTFGNAPSFAAEIDPRGNTVLFSTLSTNLDAVNPNDTNPDADVLAVDLASVRANGNVSPRRISVDSLGQSAESQAAGGKITGFRTRTGSFTPTLLTAFRTSAENLGATRQDVVTKVLDADEGEITDFAADPVVGPPTLSVAFTDLSSGIPTAWSWSFGDGGTSAAQNPTYDYQNPGEYDVTLRVTRGGVQDVVVKQDFVRVLAPLSITGFSASETSGPTPFQTTFTPVLQGSTEGIAYLWNFGDGNTSTDAIPTHTYTTVGTFDVSLNVTGLAGSDSATEIDYITTITPSGANFTFVRAGLRTNFTDQSTGTITSRLWDFGDGTTSTATNPTHDYADNGSYLVRLTINGPGGMDSTTRLVTTNARPFVDVYNRLNPNGCFSCHGGSSPSGGLLLNANASTVYGELVNVLAEGPLCDNNIRRRIVPYNTGASLMLQTVTPGSGACNSGAGGMGTWGASDRAILSDWIQDGAARN